MKNTSLLATIRLVLIPIFVVVLVVGCAGTYLLLRHYATARANDDARLILTTAGAIRSYTQDQVLADLSQTKTGEFHETSVPAFAAQSVFKRVQQSDPAYSYREPTLNPTNPNNRPTSFEVDLINAFRADPKLGELTGIRESSADSVYYLARPIKITNAACLECHSTPDKAPPAMLAKYGSSNGFGWQLDETVGIQTLTVPIAELLKGSMELTISLAAGLLIVFAFTYFAITYALHITLVRPLRDLALAAEVGSVTTNDGVVIGDSGTKEIHELADAIRRLRTSLLKSLRRLSSTDSAPQT